MKPTYRQAVMKSGIAHCQRIRLCQQSIFGSSRRYASEDKTPMAGVEQNPTILVRDNSGKNRNTKQHDGWVEKKAIA